MFRLKHFITPVCACVALLCAVATAPAQDEPIRLQKKAKPPEATPPKAGEKDKEKDKGKTDEKPKAKSETLPGKIDPKDELKTEDPDELEREVQETINRLSKNFRTVEDKLQKKEPGDGTQKVQKDIIEDLDKLIEQTKQQEEQMQKEQSQEKQQQQGQKQGQKSGQSKRQKMMQAQKNRQQRNRSAQRQPRPGQQQGQLSRQQGQPQQPGEDPQGNGNPMGEREGSRREAAPKVADLYKDIWGHLPETLRQEMTQYTREQFMPKYNELLKQYYATIAEKGRKPGDR